MKYFGLLLLFLYGPLAAQTQEPTFQTPIQPIVKSFESLDNYGDGYITRAEAENENFYDHWDAADKNKDDVVSRQEFIDYLAKEQPRLGEEVPVEDLPQAELRERLGGGSEGVVTNPELLPKIRDDFKSLDDNEDRKLTREEVSGSTIFDHFSHMDRNHDGAITQQEYNDYLYRYGTQVADEDLVERVERERPSSR